MATTLASLGLVVTADGFIRGMTDAERAMDKAEAAGTKLEERAKKIGLAMKVAAIAAASWIAKEVIANTIEAEHAFAQLEAGVRSTGGAAGFTAEALRDQADALQEVSTFSGEAVQGAQAILLTFTQIKGVNFTAATQAVADLATRMGGDMKGAAVQVGKALNDPINGVTALTKVGVSFTDAQKEVIKKMVETGDVAGAQQLILKELSVEFGGSAAAARNTLGGALTHLRNKFGDALEMSGQFSGGMRGAIDAIADAIGPARDLFDSFFSNFELGSIEAAAFFEDFGNKVERMLGRMLIKMAEWINTLGEVIPGLSDIAGKMNTLGNNMIQATQADTAALKKWRDEQVRSVLGLDEVAKKATITTAAFGDLATGTTALTGEEKKHQDSLSKMAEALREEIIGLEKGEKALADYKFEKELAGKAPPVATEIEVRQLAALRDRAVLMAEALKLVPQPIVEIREEFRLLATEVPETTGAVLDLSKEVSSMSVSVGDRLGGFFDDVFGAVQKEVEDAKDALSDFFSFLGSKGSGVAAAGVAGLVGGLLASLADEIFSGATSMSEAVAEWKKSWAEVIESIEDWARRELGLDNEFEQLQNTIEDKLKEAFDALLKFPGLDPAVWAIRGLRGTLEDVEVVKRMLASDSLGADDRRALEQYLKALEEIQAVQDHHIQQLLEEAAAAGKLDEALMQLGAAFGTVEDWVKEFIANVVAASQTPAGSIPFGDGNDRTPHTTGGGRGRLGPLGDGIFFGDDVVGGSDPILRGRGRWPLTDGSGGLPDPRDPDTTTVIGRGRNPFLDYSAADAGSRGVDELRASSVVNSTIEQGDVANGWLASIDAKMSSVIRELTAMRNKGLMFEDNTANALLGT